MTDDYPPFRLDMGGTDLGSVPAGPTAPTPSGVPTAASPASMASASTASSAASWTAGRIALLVGGVILLFGAAGMFVGGGTLLWASQTQREGDYLMTPVAEVGTDEYAITSESFRLEDQALDWVIDEVVGRARLEVTPVDGGDDLFVGVARSRDADDYLRGVGYVELDELNPRFDSGEPGRFTTTDHPGGAPAQPPTEIDIWVASSSGTGAQALTWRASEGNWTVVVMRADGAAGITAEVQAGATAPGLASLIGGLFVAGWLLLALGGLCIALAVHRANTTPPAKVPAPGSPTAPSGPTRTEPVYEHFAS